MPNPVDPELLAAREAAWRAWFAGDERGLRAALPPDFRAINMEGMDVRDLAHTIESSRAFASAGGRLIRLTFPDTIAQHYGDVAILYGTYEAVLHSASGESTLRGRLTEVFIKSGGRWLHPGWHLDLLP